MKHIYLFIFLLLVPGCTWFESSVDTCDSEKNIKNRQEVAKMVENSFTKAAVLGNVDEVKKQIAQGIDVNIRDEKIDEMTPLMFASHLGNIDIVKLLLESGAHVDAKSKGGQTALLFAADGGCNAIVRELLAHGANIAEREYDHDYKDGEEVVVPGRSALMIAVQNKHPQIVKTLIDKGSPKELLNEHYRIGSVGNLSPLQLASMQGSFEIVDILIKSGADIKKDGTTSLALAARQLEEITHPWGFESKPIEPSQAIKIMKLLIQHGADVTAGDNKTLLHIAMENPQYETVKYILDTVGQKMPIKEFIARENSNGLTALTFAQQLLKEAHTQKDSFFASEERKNIDAEQLKRIENQFNQSISNYEKTIKLLESYK